MVSPDWLTKIPTSSGPTAGAYWAQSQTTQISGNDQSYQGRLDYSVDRVGAKAEFLSVGRNFAEVLRALEGQLKIFEDLGAIVEEAAPT